MALKFLIVCLSLSFVVAARADVCELSVSDKAKGTQAAYQLQPTSMPGGSDLEYADWDRGIYANAEPVNGGGYKLSITYGDSMAHSQVDFRNGKVKRTNSLLMSNTKEDILLSLSCQK